MSSRSPGLLERHAAASVRAALADTRIVVVNGARQAGKSTLALEVARERPDARELTLDDPAVLEGLMQTFRKKYPDEIGKWEPKMRKGFETGERILIGYSPV